MFVNFTSIDGAKIILHISDITLVEWPQQKCRQQYLINHWDITKEEFERVKKIIDNAYSNPTNPYNI